MGHAKAAKVAPPCKGVAPLSDSERDTGRYICYITALNPQPRQMGHAKAAKADTDRALSPPNPKRVLPRTFTHTVWPSLTPSHNIFLMQTLERFFKNPNATDLLIIGSMSYLLIAKKSIVSPTQCGLRPAIRAKCRSITVWTF